MEKWIKIGKCWHNDTREDWINMKNVLSVSIVNKWTTTEVTFFFKGGGSSTFPMLSGEDVDKIKKTCKMLE